MEKLYEGKSKIVYAGEAPGTCVIPTRTPQLPETASRRRICPARESSMPPFPTHL